MADDLHYVPGDFYRVCDQTGFKVRAGRTKKQWNNYIVRERSFELRQPQDFVRGVRDDQTVPQPRPRSPNVFLQPSTTLAQGPGDFSPSDFSSMDFFAGPEVIYDPGSSTFVVTDISIFNVGDTVALMQNDGTQLISTVTVVDVLGSSITTATPSTWFMSPGNVVNDLTYPQLQPAELPPSNGNF